MKTSFKHSSIALVLALVLTCSAFALGDEKEKTSDKDKTDASAPATAAPPAPAPVKAKVGKDATPAQISEELQQMRELLMAQQAQIDSLRTELAARPAMTLKAANSLSGVAAQDDKVSKDIADLKLNATNTAQTVSDLQKQVSGPDGPANIRYKGISITPGGFLASETAWRSHATGADVNTALNSIPFSAASQARTSEFNASGRQSRIALLAEGKAGNIKMSGYYEADFLSAGVTSNYNQSNSFTMRQRQVWAQAALDNGFTFTGGQQWSLVTETRNLLNNRSEALPGTIDAQYNVGFTWARQFGFRVTKKINDKFAVGISVENAQTLFANRNNPANTLIAAPGTNGGLLPATNNFSNNKAPDFIFKGAVEPTKNMHLEAFGIVSTFRTRVFPCAVLLAGACISIPTVTTAGATGAFNDTRVTGGIGANGRVYLVNRKVELGLHGLIGDGVGRYSSATLPDVTSRGDGTLAPIRTGSTLGTFELHPNPKLDIYINIGAEYAARAAYVNPYAAAGSAGAAIGYGNNLFNNSGCGTELVPTNQNTPQAPGGCAGDTRDLIEGTLGFWHKFYAGPKGQLRWGIQYSYLTRNAWSGTNNGTGPSIKPHAIDNMVFTSFRYYLP